MGGHTRDICGRLLREPSAPAPKDRAQMHGPGRLWAVSADPTMRNNEQRR